jgi:hypothetical protein
MDRGYSRRCGVHGTALWRWSVAAALLAPALCLAACASDDHPGRREGRRGGGESGPPARPSLFISPAGEPFRAGPGEPYPVAAWFRGADANGDGKLTRDEFVADAARFFQALDANHDGVIDGAELKAYEAEIVPEITEERAAEQGRPQTAGSTSGDQGGGGGGGGRRGRRRGGGGAQGGPGQGGAPGGGLPQAQGAAPYGLLGEREPVAAADLDLNSRITLNNFKAKAAQRFATLDMDGKGYLLLAELPKTPAQQGGRRGRGGGQRPPGAG